MEDTSKQTANEAIRKFTEAFKNNIADASNKAIEGRNNSLAVNTLLTSLFGEEQKLLSDYASLQQASASSQLDKYRSEDSTKPATPSYNTRAPYVELWLNGLQVAPLTSKNELLKDLDINFSNLTLEMPFGGVAGTVTGSLVLFTRTPYELLTFLVDATVEGEAGLPLLEMRIGWSISDSTGNPNLSLLSPKMSFLGMDITMTDPGAAQGSEMTIRLQDAGSAVLNNSSCDAFIEADYPQQQLRVILEGLLGVRLFTLDDLMYFEGRNAPSKVGDPDPSINEDATFFVSGKLPGFRVNSNTLMTAAQKVLQDVKCRWYPVKNTSIKDEIAKSIDAENALAGLQRTANSQEALNAYTTQIALGCSLVWVPFVPKEWQTTGSDFYGTGYDMQGAYFLLPDAMLTPEIVKSVMPLIYGPGGSSAPYLYGAAQNLFQDALQKTGITSTSSKLYGEVLSLTASHSSLLANMKLLLNEDQFVVESGKRLSLQSNVSIKNNTAVQTAEEKQKALEAKKPDILKKTTGNKSVSDFKDSTIDRLNKLRQDIKVFGLKKHMLKKTISPRTMLFADSTTNGLEAKDRQYRNSLPGSTEAAKKLAMRVSRLINLPTSIGMLVMGDPLLLRQGIGAFELINYYPSVTTKELKYNAFVSGVYMPKKMVHKVSNSEYVTEISAFRLPEIGAGSNSTRSFKTYVSEMLTESPEAALGITDINIENLATGTTNNPFIQTSEFNDNNKRNVDTLIERLKASRQ